MMRSLGRNYWDQNEAISQIPPYIEVFSKNGCVNAVRSEVLLVNARTILISFAFLQKTIKTHNGHMIMKHGQWQEKFQ